MDHIDAIRQQAAAAKLQAEADYQRLADSLARGEKPPADVLRILADAGRTADHLEQSVRVARERQHLEPMAARFAEIQKDRGEAEAALRAADEKASAELDEFRAKLLARLEPLRKRAADLQEAEAESRGAKSRLQHLTARPAAARRNLSAPTVTTADE